MAGLCQTSLRESNNIEQPNGAMTMSNSLYQ